MNYAFLLVKRITALTCLCLALPGYSEEVAVAVAANFTAPMTVIAENFEEKTGHKAVISFGSSGKIYAQIINGAPFEVFLSADSEKPETLEKQGKTVMGSRFTYALGSLVLWSKDNRFADRLPAALEQGDYQTLAIANPKLAPYGAAALEVIDNLGIDPKRIPRLVQGENIVQTYQFVSTGNADLGFIALSQVMAAGRITGGTAWMVPSTLHSPIRQDAVLLTRGAGNPAAITLLDYLKSPEAQAVIHAFGYELATN